MEKTEKELKLEREIENLRSLLPLASPEQAATLNEEIRKKVWLLEKAGTALTFISDTETEEVRDEKRKYGAVRHRGKSYLPHQKAGYVILPNSLIRSALFASSDEPVEHKRDSDGYVPIGSRKDITLRLKGSMLNWYDRKVFSCCLTHYAGDLPLPSESSDEGWHETTFYKFAQALKVSYGASTHTAIRNSIVRLSGAELCLQTTSGRNCTVPHLIEIDIIDDYKVSRLKPRGRDKLRFRVCDPVAELFGVNSWTAIPKEALAYKGFPSWLAAYLASNDELITLPLAHLQKISGATADMDDFKDHIKRALNKLSQPKVHDRIRILQPYKLDTKAEKLHMQKAVVTPKKSTEEISS
ncbi:hypothetical protein EDC30_11923 [Paucimonas lemoignei]|uniref:Uncharacterized protein n=1 Tax=Paucimonas lemoignei TaxID=29443 RepID=A0A4R3HQ97_PAULE|nr:hypothetical protein [Paucimonas lemoignei]TCS32912.1 hypothetical protein EDC30_11923 [Paucimonas lemoignei]